MPGKIDASLNEKLQNVEWGEYRLGDLFEIENTLSFNSEELVDGNEYDYVTRTSSNQGILRSTGFVNAKNLNNEGTWSLGLLQMDFFYRKRKWYAGQFVRKITPKIEISKKAVPFFSTVLNRTKSILLSVLVRNVDNTFKQLKVFLPTKSGNIDFDFMEKFMAELESEKLERLHKYIKTSGIEKFELTSIEKQAIKDMYAGKIIFKNFEFQKIFNNIKQGKRLKKEDQIPGKIPFVMAGVMNAGVVNYVSNPVALFPKNSITIDIFGNTFYRNFVFGAGDDTGVYWNSKLDYSKEVMLFFATTMSKALAGKYSFGKKLRSSQSFNFKMQLPVVNGNIDYKFMETLITAIKKIVLKDIVEFIDSRLAILEKGC